MAFFLLCISSLLLVFISYIFQPLVDARRRLPRRDLAGYRSSATSTTSARTRTARFARLADRHGPLVSIRLGGVRAVVATSADVAREIL
uniref:Uncharacterized protein n=1 Tax=Oryza meridionalis TaxID=40149 RepID=A0A0E0EW72_9ORYZ